MAGEAEVSVNDCDTCRSKDSTIADPFTTIGPGRWTVVVPVPCEHKPWANVETVMLPATKVTLVKEQPTTVTTAAVYLPCGTAIAGSGSEAPFKCIHSRFALGSLAPAKMVTGVPALLVREMLAIGALNPTS